MKQEKKKLFDGMVVSRSAAQFQVLSGENIVSCIIKNSKGYKPDRPKKMKNTSRNMKQVRGDHTCEKLDIAVGDIVQFEYRNESMGIVLDRIPRRNVIQRRSAVAMPGAFGKEQVIAANVDLMLPVISSALPDPRWGLLDRYLVLAEEQMVTPVVCVTKYDLIQSDEIKKREQTAVVELYRSIGYRVIELSAKTGVGLDELQECTRGKVCVLLGKSGAGKSSILNTLIPGLNLKTNEINTHSGKGRHTTTQAEIHPMVGGGGLIDTPGVREFGLWQLDVEQLDWNFPEMQPFLGNCKFGSGCCHLEEPGCAVRSAVTSGHISPFRYRSYVKLYMENL